MAVALNANPLQTYVSGILDKASAQCPTIGINHAVLLVGYGTGELPSWLLKTLGEKAGEKIGISELEEEMEPAVLLIK